MTKDGVEIGDFGFLEIMGCDGSSNILEAANIDSKKYNGFALGLGIERVAMLNGMSDLENSECRL